MAVLLALSACGGRNPEPEEPEGPTRDLGDEEEAKSNDATKDAAEQLAEEGKEAADQVEGEPVEPKPQ